MTVQDLVDWCNANGVSLDTHIAVRSKDDFFITEEKVYLDCPYFGNCSDGAVWERENIPENEDGDLDYGNAPKLLILDSESE